MSKQCCKYCGNEFDASGINWSLDNNLLVVGEVRVRLSQMQGVLFDFLFKNIGKASSLEKLITANYGGYGIQPDNAKNCIYMALFKLNKRIAPTAIRVTNIIDTGYLLELPTSLTQKGW